MNRRNFLSSIAATSAVVAASTKSFAADTTQPLSVGLIGCGWFGNINLELLHKNASIQVHSLCDVNQKMLTNTMEKVAKYQKLSPNTYADYRQMLQARHHDIVIIATPDHWHALPAIAAMKAGADLLLEKPVSIDVIEGESVVAAARKYQRIVQVNLQRRSSPIQKEAKTKYIDSGKLGKVALVESYFYGHQSDKKFDSVKPPEHLDYDMWAGPAPKVDYIAPMEKSGWRRFKEYGNGYGGDMGVHMFDMVRMMLDINWPTSISASGGIFVNKNATGSRTDTQTSVFNYPDLTVTWEHRMWGKSPIPQRHWTDQWAARFVGTKGTLTVNLFGYEFEPNDGSPKEGYHLMSRSKDLENIDFDNWEEAFDELSAFHKQDLIQAIQSRKKPNADVEQGHISSACCILANLSLQLGRSLRYDPKTRTVLDDPEGTALLSRPYQGDWQHPTPENV
ncbi:Gfo/Idh/MocA family protein [Paraglaciecola sp.]|uniref:Gfo/Idh/MocA family protein n=1 Tax=Paraglaciecola sp. TaxID=1920173 RepID=UPI003EF438AF